MRAAAVGQVGIFRELGGCSIQCEHRQLKASADDSHDRLLRIAYPGLTQSSSKIRFIRKIEAVIKLPACAEMPRPKPVFNSRGPAFEADGGSFEQSALFCWRCEEFHVSKDRPKSSQVDQELKLGRPADVANEGMKHAARNVPPSRPP
jgi:hypothetical protein